MTYLHDVTSLMYCVDQEDARQPMLCKRKPNGCHFGVSVVCSYTSEIFRSDDFNSKAEYDYEY
jgi:hypothetical protein